MQNENFNVFFICCFSFDFEFKLHKGFTCMCFYSCNFNFLNPLQLVQSAKEMCILTLYAQHW